jgi:uncharacterized membrane protein/mono/diheme cytochrome c family protein
MVLPLLVAVGTLAIFAWQRPPDGSAHGEDIYRFLGRLHPSMTHFPIGLLILMPILDLLGVFRRSRHLWATGQLVMWLATLGMILAATAGYLLARFDGHGGEDVLDHQLTGIITAAWCCLALLFRSLARGGVRRVIWGFLYVVSLTFALIGLVIAGHLGGKITHGDDYLTEYAPQPIRELMKEFDGKDDARKDEDDGRSTPLPTITPTTTPSTLPAPSIEPAAAAPMDRTVFASIVQPIFAQHCIECHGAKKVKGDLRLDSFAAAMRGGENGSTIVPGSVSDSELARLIKLPASDDDVMPPSKEPRLSAEEVEAITWWIAQGASETQALADANVPANILPLAR